MKFGGLLAAILSVMGLLTLGCATSRRHDECVVIRAGLDSDSDVYVLLPPNTSIGSSGSLRGDAKAVVRDTNVLGPALLRQGLIISNTTHYSVVTTIADPIVACRMLGALGVPQEYMIDGISRIFVRAEVLCISGVRDVESFSAWLKSGRVLSQAFAGTDDAGADATLQVCIGMSLARQIEVSVFLPRTMTSAARGILSLRVSEWANSRGHEAVVLSDTGGDIHLLVKGPLVFASEWYGRYLAR